MVEGNPRPTTSRPTRRCGPPTQFGEIYCRDFFVKFSADNDETWTPPASSTSGSALQLPFESMWHSSPAASADVFIDSVDNSAGSAETVFPVQEAGIVVPVPVAVRHPSTAVDAEIQTLWTVPSTLLLSRIAAAITHEAGGHSAMWSVFGDL